MLRGVDFARRAAATGLAVAIAALLAPLLAAASTADQNANSTPAPAPAPAGGIQCTSSVDGVSYSVEHCNLTGKSILKILVQDDYNVTLPSAPIIASPLEASATTEEKTPEVTTEHEPSNKDTSDYDIFHSNYEYYSSDEEPFTGSKDSVIHKILEKEWERHEETHHPPSWEEFCKEATKEDDEPIHVTDGSFHPRYEEVPGVGVYRLHARARSWAEARRVCEREGAQLAVPNSREEALALVAIHNRCPRLLPSHFNDYQYLGAHDDYKEGGWETVVGYPLEETGYVNWAINQPDNAHHHGENCLTMNRQSFFNDVPCWTELPFICEHV